MLRMALFISSLDSFSLRHHTHPPPIVCEHRADGARSAQVGNNLSPDGHLRRIVLPSRRYLERRMLQFCARRPSITDSSFTFLPPGASSSASFCKAHGKT